MIEPLLNLFARRPIRATAELLAASACGGACGFVLGPIGMVPAVLIGVALAEYWHRTGRLAPGHELEARRGR